MKSYLSLMRQVLTEGTRQQNRTGIATLSLPGAMLQFDLAKGFPAVTTKRLAWKQVVGELLGFIRGCTDAADFRALGCTIWDQNANENASWLNNQFRTGTDDLGRIYGAQWRAWPMADGHHFDQLATAMKILVCDPESRRNIVMAWNPAELHQMALPPCHVLFRLSVNQETMELNLSMYQRSCDLFLGVPFNIASYALLNHMIAHAVGLMPGKLTMFLDDVHIYENHIEQVQEQLSREPTELPALVFSQKFQELEGKGMATLTSATPEMFILADYNPHPAIKADMAV